VFQNRVLRRIFELRDDGKNCIMRSFIICTLRHLQFKLRRITWAGHAAQVWEKKNANRILVVKPEGKRPLGRPRRW
jgi:hypothetical protein